MGIEPQDKQCRDESYPYKDKNWDLSNWACCEDQNLEACYKISYCPTAYVAKVCDDPGKWRHWSSVTPDPHRKWPDSPNGWDRTINHNQFVESIESLNNELDGAKVGRVYQKLTSAALKAIQIAEVRYQFVQTFGNSGGGGGGFQTHEIEVKYGRSSEREISNAVMTRIEVTQEWGSEVLGGGGGVTAEAQYDFSDTVNSAKYREDSMKKTVHLDFDKPNYIYNKKLTIVFKNGRYETIWGGVYISHKEGGEPL